MTCFMSLVLQPLGSWVAAARFDTSSGDIDYHLETLANLKAAMAKTNKLCAVRHVQPACPPRHDRRTAQFPRGLDWN